MLNIKSAMRKALFSARAAMFVPESSLLVCIFLALLSVVVGLGFSIGLLIASIFTYFWIVASARKLNSYSSEMIWNHHIRTRALPASTLTNLLKEKELEPERKISTSEFFLSIWKRPYQNNRSVEHCSLNNDMVSAKRLSTEQPPKTISITQHTLLAGVAISLSTLSMDAALLICLIAIQQLIIVYISRRYASSVNFSTEVILKQMNAAKEKFAFDLLSNCDCSGYPLLANECAKRGVKWKKED